MCHHLNRMVELNKEINWIPNHIKIVLLVNGSKVQETGQ